MLWIGIGPDHLATKIEYQTDVTDPLYSFIYFHQRRDKPEIYLLLLTTHYHVHDGCLAYPESIWSICCPFPQKLMLHVHKMQYVQE